MLLFLYLINFWEKILISFNKNWICWSLSNFRKSSLFNLSESGSSKIFCSIVFICWVIVKIKFEFWLEKKIISTPFCKSEIILFFALISFKYFCFVKLISFWRLELFFAIILYLFKFWVINWYCFEKFTFKLLISLFFWYNNWFNFWILSFNLIFSIFII